MNEQDNNNKKYMEKLNYKIELPFFPGFYETIISSTNMLNNMMECEDTYKSFIDEYGIDFSKDDIDMDENKYQKDVSKMYVENFSKYLPKYIKSIKYSNTVNQKEYNFMTDEIYVDIEYKPTYRKELLKFINKYYEQAKEYVHKRWTSRDGFYSRTDNNIDNWRKYIINNDISELFLSELLKMYFMFDYLPKHHDIYSLKDFDWYEDARELFVDPIYYKLSEMDLSDYLVYNKVDWIDREQQIFENEEILKIIAEY